MKVVEDNSSIYSVRRTQYGGFIITILGIVFGFIIYKSNNLVGIISNLIGIGAIFLPFKETVSVDNTNKKLIVYWSGILGGRKKEYDIGDIKKFILTSNRKSISFNATIFSSQKGFIENISLFSLNQNKGGFYLRGYTPKYSTINIPDMPYFNKISELCGKKIEYLDNFEAIKETVSQVSGMIEKYQKDRKST
ncbi:MAG: hypothetical protein AABX85_04575 [Nanoarchaeota archaeon]